MKRLALFFVLILMIAPIPASAQGQWSRPLLKADIPFDFSVMDRTFDRGTYVIDEIGQHAMRLRSTTNNDTIMFLTNSMLKPRADFGRNVLIFHRYGSEYVLSELWTGTNGAQLRTSKREVQLARGSKPKPTAVEMEVGK